MRLGGAPVVHQRPTAGPHGARAPATPVLGLAEPGIEETQLAFVDGALLEAVLSTDRPGGPGLFDLFLIRRTDLAAPFDSSTPLAVVNTAEHELDPVRDSVTNDLYFVSTRAGGGATDLYRAAHVATTWGAPVAVTTLNTARNDAALTFAPGGGAVLFMNDTADLGDIYFAPHLEGGVFGATTRVDALSSADFDGEPHISPDGCEVCFVRREAGLDWQLYMADVGPAGG